MGIMKAWESWSQRQWDNWGSKLSPIYKQIEGMEWSPEMKAVIDAISNKLPKTIAESILKIVVDLYKKVGPKVAEEWLRQILETIKNIHI